MDTYNGWENKATWLVGLWLDNDEATYTYIREVAEDKTAIELSDWLKEYVEENNPLNEASLYNDLLTWAIALCNFDEIAKNIKEE